MENLKDLFYNADCFAELASDLKRVYPPLDVEQFQKDAITGLEALELKERIKRATAVCKTHLPQDYKEALKVLYAYGEGKDNKFFHLFMSDFVAQHGLDHFDESVPALRDFTQYSSSEDAVRPFILHQPELMFKTMLEWTQHDNEHVRRLASEGSRPRLPWAIQLINVVKNPELTWPILEALKTDSSKYVQKSVANHINDISKDHPDWLMEKLVHWDMGHKATSWIIKHGCRTLIKAGHPKTLALFGFAEAPQIAIDDFRLSEDEVSMGDTITFSFAIRSTHDQPQKLVVDYKFYFMKKNGKAQPKVFKLKEMVLAPNESISVKKHYTFQNLTTRKHYAGTHAIELFINGTSLDRQEFELVMD